MKRISSMSPEELAKAFQKAAEPTPNQVVSALVKELGLPVCEGIELTIEQARMMYSRNKQELLNLYGEDAAQKVLKKLNITMNEKIWEGLA